MPDLAIRSGLRHRYISDRQIPLTFFNAKVKFTLCWIAVWARLMRSVTSSTVGLAGHEASHRLISGVMMSAIARASFKEVHQYLSVSVVSCEAE